MSDRCPLGYLLLTVALRGVSNKNCLLPLFHLSHLHIHVLYMLCMLYILTLCVCLLYTMLSFLEEIRKIIININYKLFYSNLQVKFGNIGFSIGKK